MCVESRQRRVSKSSTPSSQRINGPPSRRDKSRWRGSNFPRTSRGWNCVKSLESSITRERDLPTPLNASFTAIAFDIDLIFQRFFVFPSYLSSLPYYYYYYYSLLSKKFRLHLLASLGNLENWKWKKCVNLFRINRISILFRDIRATRNARLPLRNIWRDNSSKENHGLVPSALKIPLIRVISGKGRASDSAFGPVFTPSIRVGDLRVHDRQSRLSTCDDVSPLLLSRRLFPRSLNDSSRVIVQTMPHTGKFVGSIEKIERSICN